MKQKFFDCVIRFRIPIMVIFVLDGVFRAHPGGCRRNTRYPRMGLDVERLLARAVRIFRIRRRRNPHDLCAAARPREARAG